MISQYEQFGSNYRIPKAVKDDGGPANNPADLTDPANPEGRPRTAQPADGQPADGTANSSQPRPPESPAPAPAAQSPGAMAGAPAPEPQQTFQQMQQAGLARPPAPVLMAAPPPGPTDTGGMNVPGVSMIPPPTNPLQTPAAPNAPAPLPADGGLEGQLKSAYEGYKPQEFATGGNPALKAQIEAMLSSSMGSPSRYDTDVAKDSFNMLSQNIDDDYNARDQNLRESIASRGLGSVGDSSIGTGDQRYQNLQRRTAKQDMASGILREQANTYGADRSSAIRDAMGYGNDQFSNDLQGAQYNANQQQQAYNNYSDYGKTAFDNQMRTNDAKRTQDLDQQNLLMKMLGLA